jgi:hypothetical protein
MRFLNISGPGVATDDEYCPHCHVRLEYWDSYQVCSLCHFDSRQQTAQPRLGLRWR